MVANKTHTFNRDIISGGAEKRKSMVVNRPHTFQNRLTLVCFPRNEASLLARDSQRVKNRNSIENYTLAISHAVV